MGEDKEVVRKPRCSGVYGGGACYRCPMAAYRIYFRSATTIIGREDFEAGDDQGAMAVAWLLWDACSDLAHGFELWQGSRELCERRGPLRAALSAAEVTERMQASVVETEEAIQRSKWAIAQSRRLLSQLAQARRNRSGSP